MRCHGATDMLKPVRSNSSDNTIPDSNNVMSTAAVTVDAEVKASRKNALISEKKCFTSLASLISVRQRGAAMIG